MGYLVRDHESLFTEQVFPGACTGAPCFLTWGHQVPEYGILKPVRRVREQVTSSVNRSHLLGYS